MTGNVRMRDMIYGQTCRSCRAPRIEHYFGNTCMTDDGEPNKVGLRWTAPKGGDKKYRRGAVKGR